MKSSKPIIENRWPIFQKRRWAGLNWQIISVVMAVFMILAVSACTQSPPAEPDAPVSPAPIADSQSPQPDDTPTFASQSTSAEEFFQEGNSFAQSGQLQNAVTAYQKAIELDPEYQAVYANLGVVYYQLEQLDLAAQQYEKALELNPDDGEVTYNLGALNLQRALISGTDPDPELMTQAISLLERALELSPGLAEPYFSLGVAYIAQNNKEKAIESFQSFLEKDSGNDPRASQEAQRYLDTLNAN